MKKTFTNLWLSLCVAAVAVMGLTPITASADTGTVYKITFGGRGESKVVDNVLVENLSTGASVELQGQDILLLKAKSTAINKVEVENDGDVSTEGGMLSVTLQNPSDVQVDVYALDGRLAWQTCLAASSKVTSVPLPPLARGMYVVSATAPGFTKSINWLSYGNSSFTVPDFSAEANNAVAETEEIDPIEAINAMANAPKEVELAYNRGDVLRFTGTSGNMTSITTGSPRCSFTQHFDFFKCQDADGHNYAIVRAGDMLWMAEDLRKVNSLGITDASTLSSDILNKLIGDNTTELVATDGDKTYYSKPAAIRALPEGWKLPTQGEIDYVIKKLNGGKYSIAGEYFKGDNKDGVDSTFIRLNLNGRYNGNVCDDGNAYLMTRSTKGGETLAMQLSETANSVNVDVCPGYMLSVRGVRSAPSAYTEMLEDMKAVSSNEESIPAPTQSALEDRGPLGKTYIMHTVPQSIAYDFSGGQFSSDKGENRSGILTKDSEGNWTLGERRDVDFLSDLDIDNVNDKNKLRKMAVLNNGNGTQYILEMQWSRPFRIVTERLANENSDGSLSYSYQRTDTPDVFGLGNVYLTIAGDAQSGHGLIHEKAANERYGFSLPAVYDFAALPKSILPYFLYDDSNRATETRMDYVQRCFQLFTADFNEDGVDEVIVGIDGQVDIYDGATMLNVIKEGDSEYLKDNQYTKPCLHHKNFKLQDDGVTEFDCSAYYLKKPMVRFAIGDVDGDGVSDLSVLRVGAGGEEGKAKIELMVYGAGDVTTEPIAYSCIDYDASANTIFNDIKIGNVSGSKYNDIIMLFRNYSGTALAKKGYMWHAMYDPNNTDTHLRIDSDNVGENGSFRGYDGHIGNTNITLAHFRGPEYPCDIVCGADLWRWNSETEKIEFCDFQVLPFTDNTFWSIFADNIIAADVDGQGYDKLYYFRNWDTYESSNGNRLMFQGLSETYFDSTTDISKSTLKHYHNFNSDLLKYCDTGKIWDSGELKQVELQWWFGPGDVEWGNNSALCAVYDRPGHKVLQYKGHELAFTEPRIYALIAAPPTFDYGDEIEPNYDFVTSWGYSKSTSQQTTNSSSVSASLIVGFEQEITAPVVGTKLGGVEFTTKMEQECSKSTSKTSTISFSQLYEARDDDRVVMQVAPYDNYTYEIVASDNVDEIGGLLNISIPQKPMTVGLALTDYDRYTASDKNAPDIHQVFHHTIGDPFSYPSTADKIVTNVPDSEILWGNGRWNDFVTTGSGGSVIREIALDNSTATSAAFSFSVESELVVQLGCAKTGVGFGYGNTNETTHEESEGFTVSACVPGLAPGDTNPNRKFFNWNLCWYKYSLNGQTFPVVNYVVK